ncbi:MAG: hypothetical protein GAK31_02160 [Stenotrophomonas maltophilia]|uniref:Secreted protein n=1 Tax=Stenotrophomonas maltophilia TaxID=40324 RepID=A0A7V8JL14_STEMA|nr:MAG: hypothetical protein GAK31_02160 [Stenotrophomonas maltophilia]
MSIPVRPRHAGLLSALLLAALWLPPAATAAAARGPYVDLVDYPRNEANWDRFYDLEAALMQDFHSICVDTLCAGDYSNLQVLQFRCAVHDARGSVQRCAWLVVASELWVDPQAGHIDVDTPRWVCEVDLWPGVPVEAFHAALDAPDGLTAPLPGVGIGLFDDLGGCLRGQGNQRRAG